MHGDAGYIELLAEEAEVKDDASTDTKLAEGLTLLLMPLLERSSN